MLDAGEKKELATKIEHNKSILIPSTTSIKESQYDYLNKAKGKNYNVQNLSSSAYSAEKSRIQKERVQLLEAGSTTERMAHQKGMNVDSQTYSALFYQQSNSYDFKNSNMSYKNEPQKAHQQMKKNNSYNQDKSRQWLHEHHKTPKRQFSHQFSRVSQPQKSNRNYGYAFRSEYPT